MTRVRRSASLVGALLIVAALLPASAIPVAAVGATVPTGFADEEVWTGLDHPMAVAFAPDGKVFVAEKRGTIRVFSSLADTTPTTFADLSVNVDNYWDRGLMGLAVDPGYTTGSPYVYVLYAYNHILGDGSAPPRWPTSGVNPWSEICPNPPLGTSDGCVVSGRLSRLTSNGAASPVMTGSENVLIEDWCQQFPSHSLGSLMFGPEGALYVSAGDGASFNSGSPDYGQLGGSLPGTPTPANPCGDPDGVLGPPTAEGGALRSQDIRTTADPTGLDGTILRIDPATGDAWPDNANFGTGDANSQRIIAYGLRNPFRITLKPGTDDVWIGDVGFSTWEELNHLPDPNAAALNFGWPCWEGNAVHPFFDDLGLAMCDSLSAGSVSTPYYTYNHASHVVSGDGCSVGSSSISGLAFLPPSSSYPSSYDNGLFFTDYSRKCIWFMPAGSGGDPNVAGRQMFANLVRPSGDTSGGAVFLTVAPSTEGASAGDLVYADYDRGEVRRIHYYGANVPPVASFTAMFSGPALLTVAFNASGSSDVNGDPLTYAWDLDGDGQFDDATGVTTSKTYASAGNVDVGLKVSDGAATDTLIKTISVGHAPPTVTITAPASSLTWVVGQSIAFSATATDPQDGTLPASAFEWTIDMQHCPSDCHTHIITEVSGVKSGTVDGPDHEYPSHLRLTVTVTDSNGLTDTDQVEIYPKTGTVAAVSNPAGIPITVPATTGIVGSTITVTAPDTGIVGEGVYSFVDWSDDSSTELTHAVPIVEGATTVTANYTRTGTVDRSDTCSGSPAAVAPTGKWTAGSFDKTNDVDWYRFKLTSTTRVRLALGDLTTGGRMDLYKGCTTLLQTSNRAGNTAEEIIKSLAAGTYAVKFSGSGDGSTPAYAGLIRSMPASVHLLSTRNRIDDGTLRLIGELYNNSTHTVGPVLVTAKLYNASNALLATRSSYADLSYLPVATRSPVRIVGSLPAGFDHVKWSVSAPTSSRSLGLPVPKVAVSGFDSGGHYHVSGTVTNPYSAKVTSLRLAVTLYDTRGEVLDAVRAHVGTTTLSAGKSTTYWATFVPVGLAPNRTYTRGVVFR